MGFHPRKASRLTPISNSYLSEFRGKNKPENLFSFGYYVENDTYLNWPSDILQLGYQGNGAEIGRRYDLSQVKGRSDATGVLHFGINKEVNDKWRVGARAKCIRTSMR